MDKDQHLDRLRGLINEAAWEEELGQPLPALPPALRARLLAQPEPTPLRARLRQPQLRRRAFLGAAAGLLAAAAVLFYVDSVEEPALRGPLVVAYLPANAPLNAQGQLVLAGAEMKPLAAEDLTLKPDQTLTLSLHCPPQKIPLEAKIFLRRQGTTQPWPVELEATGSDFRLSQRLTELPDLQADQELILIVAPAHHLPAIKDLDRPSARFLSHRVRLRIAP